MKALMFLVFCTAALAQNVEVKVLNTTVPIKAVEKKKLEKKLSKKINKGPVSK